MLTHSPEPSPRVLLPTDTNRRHTDLNLHYIHWVHLNEMLPALERTLTALCTGQRSKEVHLFFECFGLTQFERSERAGHMEYFVNRATAKNVAAREPEIAAILSSGADQQDVNTNLLVLSLWRVKQATGVGFRIRNVDVDGSSPAAQLDAASEAASDRLVPLMTGPASTASVGEMLKIWRETVELAGRSFRIRDECVAAQMESACQSISPKALKICISGALHLAQSRGIERPSKHRQFLTIPDEVAPGLPDDVKRVHAGCIRMQKTLKVANGLAINDHDLIDLVCHSALLMTLVAVRDSAKGSLSTAVTRLTSISLITLAVSCFVNSLEDSKKSAFMQALVPAPPSGWAKVLAILLRNQPVQLAPQLSERLLRSAVDLLVSELNLDEPKLHPEVIFKSFFGQALGAKFAS